MTTPEIADLSTQTLLAQMQAQMAEQAALIRQLQSERAAEGDGSLQAALREFEAANVQVTAYMQAPCQHVLESGRACGQVFVAHIEEREGHRPMPLGHTFRTKPVVSVTPRKGAYAREAKVQQVQPDDSIEATYLSVGQAAKALHMTQKAVRELVNDGQIKADKVGTTILVRKVAVDRMLALAQVEEDDADVIS